MTRTKPGARLLSYIDKHVFMVYCLLCPGYPYFPEGLIYGRSLSYVVYVLESVGLECAFDSPKRARPVLLPGFLEILPDPLEGEVPGVSPEKVVIGRAAGGECPRAGEC